MKIEKISGDKIKVTLSAADLLSYNIDITQLTPDSETLHSFLFHIMEEIRSETGFNPYNGQVVVEATPSREGISLVVSRIKSLKKITRSDIAGNVTVKAKKKKTVDRALFIFKDFDDLCDALRLLNNDELSECALYKLYDIFCISVKKPSELTRCISVLAEFAAKRSTRPEQLTYIKEHGTLIARGSSLVNMAENLKQLT